MKECHFNSDSFAPARKTHLLKRAENAGLMSSHFKSHHVVRFLYPGVLVSRRQERQDNRNNQPLEPRLARC